MLKVLARCMLLVVFLAHRNELTFLAISNKATYLESSSSLITMNHLIIGYRSSYTFWKLFF